MRDSLFTSGSSGVVHDLYLAVLRRLTAASLDELYRLRHSSAFAFPVGFDEYWRRRLHVYINTWYGAQLSQFPFATGS